MTTASQQKDKECAHKERVVQREVSKLEALSER